MENSKENVIYFCKSCEVQFEESNALIEHLKVNHKDDVETKNSSTESSKELNEKKVHAVLNCDICGKSFIIPWRLSQHKKIAHLSKNYQCESCGRHFTLEKLLKSHIDAHHQKRERIHRCESCDKSFFSVSGLKSHIRNIHNDDKKMHRCEICDREFKHQSILRRHSDTHNYDGKRTEKCNSCGKCFFTSFLLKLHIKNVQCGATKELFECNLCHKTFTRKLNLEKHRKYRHESQEFLKEIRCNLCNYSSYSIHADLKKHMKEVHEKKKLHKCNLCSSTFTRPWSVRLHIKRVHEKGPRNYSPVQVKIFVSVYNSWVSLKTF